VIDRRDFLHTAALASSALLIKGAQQAHAEDAPLECDAFVYGSTPGGIAAAVEASRRGCSVVLACPKNHAGGMAASGLCTTDAVRRKMFGGFVIEFTSRVRAYYAKTLGENSPEWKLIHDGWYYEPSVAERVFDEILVGEERLRFLKGHHIVSARVEGARVLDVELDAPGGKRVKIRAKTFIDGTYEGDLAAAAKAPYRVAREAKAEFGESLAGIYYMNWRTGQKIETPDSGEASPAIQSFCARSIFTDDAKNRKPIEKPATYEQHLSDFLPLLDDFEAKRVTYWAGGTTLPGRKFEFNGNIEWQTSFNCPGVSWAWPEADRHHRARLEKFHIDHAAGMMWFMQNDTRVPEVMRNKVKNWGLHAGEFADNGHWPWQIYVRQGRRIEGRAMITQNNFTIDPKTGKTPAVENPIALGEHSFDVHPCHDRRYAVDGYMEGVLWYPQKSKGPAQPGQIPWGALLPKKIDNLLVPVAMSCTHVAMSVLRMEPVWMTTGQIAGLAAAVAKEKNTDVALIDPQPLPVTLKILTDPS
jgi:hypothetical protein